jgi:hypothetical protein
VEGLLLITVMVRRGCERRVAPGIGAVCCNGCIGTVNDSGADTSAAVAAATAAADGAVVEGSAADELRPLLFAFVRGDEDARRGDTVFDRSLREVESRGELVARLELRGLRTDTVLVTSTDAISEVVPVLLLFTAAPGVTGIRGERVTPRRRLPVEALSAAWPLWLADETPPTFEL